MDYRLWSMDYNTNTLSLSHKPTTYMRLAKYLLLAAPAIIIAGCKPKTSSTDETPKRTVFFDKSGMDTTVKPGDNFFLYANGKWIKDTQIPPSETSWWLAKMLYNSTQKHLRQLLEDAGVNDNPQGSKEQKVADLYKSGMDTATIEKLGYEPVKPMLAKIDAVTDYKDLVKLAAAGFKDGDGFLFGFYVSPDDRIANKNVTHFDQTGLTLDEKGYYLKTDPASVKIRDEYVKYITKLFTLTGVDAKAAAAKADGILKLETEIAKSHLSPEELRDPVRNYNKLTAADFQKQVPDIDLAGAFNLMGIKTDIVLIGQPGYYKALDGLLKNQPIMAWKDKAAFGALDGAATSLSKSFVKALFDFYGKVLNGQN